MLSQMPFCRQVRPLQALSRHEPQRWRAPLSSPLLALDVIRSCRTTFGLSWLALFLLPLLPSAIQPPDQSPAVDCQFSHGQRAFCLVWEVTMFLSPHLVVYFLLVRS